jgi:hypothetical protein
MMYLNFIFVHQKFNPCTRLADHIIFPLDHLCKIGPYVPDFDTMFLEMMGRVIKMFRGIKQCLGGNASDIKAGPA